MPRHLFPGDLHLLPDGTPAANQTFSLWTDDRSGTIITDVLARDGVSAVELRTSVDGLRPYLYGPDGIEVMYVDTGTSMRIPIYADDRLRATLDESFLQSLVDRITALESGGGGGGGTGSVAGTSGVEVIFGASSPRLNPRTGAALPAGVCVIWEADTQPVNFLANQDIWLNRP